ncbi:hypothetical protein [Streptomyces sp. NPDC050485]|uniref:hypothetical protein n=1 Tax=Streptomyces sp. NPDC050485 TaxID=3365617 RepID=UPI003798D420
MHVAAWPDVTLHSFQPAMQKRVIMERRILRAAAIAIGAAALIGLMGPSANAAGLGGTDGTINSVRAFADGTIDAVGNLAGLR